MLPSYGIVYAESCSCNVNFTICQNRLKGFALNLNNSSLLGGKVAFYLKLPKRRRGKFLKTYFQSLNQGVAE